MQTRHLGMTPRSSQWQCRLVSIGLACACVLLLGERAAADEFYFMAIFGSQRRPTQPCYTHTFAVFVKATGEGPCAEQYQLEAHTISWMPRSMDIRIWRLRPECGVNLDLDATLRWALSTGQRVSMWGPFQIEKELYDRALRQIAYLQSGAVRYKAVDIGFHANSVNNCIHGVSDIKEGLLRLHVGIPGLGEVASYLVTLQLQSWIIDSDRVWDWVGDRLGLRNYPIIHRDLERGFLLRRLPFRPAEATSRGQ